MKFLKYGSYIEAFKHSCHEKKKFDMPQWLDRHITFSLIAQDIVILKTFYSILL